ncbi:MAG: 30S ribosomal protein S6 [Thermaceae bacterium]
MRTYEINIVLNPSLEPGQLALEKEIIAKALERFGAQVIKTEEWGARRLAYPIARDTQGYFIFYTVQMPHDQVAPLEKELRLRDNVRRVMIVRTSEPKTSSPSKVSAAL